MTLVDTHCHLNDGHAFPDPGLAVQEAVESGVERLVVVGVDVDSSRRALELAERHKEVYAVVGWHPNHASDYETSCLVALREMLGHPKALALGEIGLDYYRDHASRDDQYRCLVEQLGLASDCDAPVVFHCRDAYPDLLAVLEQRQPHPYLFHCFSGTAEDAARATALGAWFGVDGPVTYKSSGPLREVLTTLPRDRVVVETDSPWMAPVPHRGERNRPALLPWVNKGLSEALGLSETDCAAMTTANARGFFGSLGL